MTPRPTSAAGAVLAVDLGKTTCRLQAVGATAFHREGPGARLGYGTDGIADVQQAIQTVIQPAQAELGPGLPAVVGVAGTLQNPQLRAGLARWLADRLRAPAAVTSDVVIAHVGALGGGPGVCLIAGTGAIALGVSTDGRWRAVDGWGPDVGDLGSGSWIGRSGIVAVLDALDRGGPTTALTREEERVRHLVSQAVADPANAARTLASFAPFVLDHADAGDRVAGQIAGAAIAQLVRTARAAAFDDSQVAVLGGLQNQERFAERLAEALTDAGLAPTRPLGGAAHGALLVHQNHRSPLEGCVERATP